MIGSIEGLVHEILSVYSYTVAQNLPTQLLNIRLCRIFNSAIFILIPPISHIRGLQTATYNTTKIPFKNK